MPMRKVIDWRSAPTRAPIRLAPKAVSLADIGEKERIKMIPEKNMGMVVNAPTMTALVRYGRWAKEARSTKYNERQMVIRRE